jgi:hypothetical protein
MNEDRAISKEIFAFLLMEGNHSAKSQIRTTSQLWKSAGCLFLTILLTSNPQGDNCLVLRVTVLAKGLVSSDTGNIFRVVI